MRGCRILLPPHDDFELRHISIIEIDKLLRCALVLSGHGAALIASNGHLRDTYDKPRIDVI